MALACQQDSYLKELQTTVKSCSPAEIQIQNNGKREKLDGFEIILEDTILFPEGGGQPDDRGTIDSHEVLQVTRRGADAVHFVGEEIPSGKSVSVIVDWTRRFDHMQQHSGQHLITAIAEKLFGFHTTSWSLSSKVSTIELDTNKMTSDQMEQLEQTVNEKIRDCIPMNPQLYNNKDDPELNKVHSKGLPDDHVGPVRVVSIKGIDANMCCGTHVNNLAHLQAIKLLGVEKGKKNKINLSFVAGGRVLSYLGQCLLVEKGLTAVLKGPLEQHVELADKIVKHYKAHQKSGNTILKDLAVLEAHKFRQSGEKLIVHHRKEGDLDYMRIFVSELNSESTICLVTVGDDKGPGLFLLSGPLDRITELGPQLCEILEGKGALNGGKYSGKVNKLSGRNKAEQLLRKNIGMEDR